MRKIADFWGITLGLGLTAAIVGSLILGPPLNASRAQPQVSTVDAVNSLARPIFVEDVDNPARQAFSVNICTSAGSPLTCGGIPQTFAAPATGHTVIEQVSGVCGTNGQPSFFVRLNSTVGGSGNAVTVLNQVPNAPFGTLVPATLTRIYPDPGTPTQVGFPEFASDGTGNAACTVTLIGYTIRP